MNAPAPSASGVLELLNTGDSVGGIKAEAHALVRGAGGPREVQGARILARCDELEASLAEARTTVEAMAEALEAAKNKLHEMADDFADSRFSDRHGDGPAMRSIANRCATVLDHFHGRTES